MSKIALFLPSLAGGGAERVCLYLADAFAERGFAVDMVLMTSRGSYLSEVPKSVHLVNLGCPRMWTSLPSLLAYLSAEKPDYLISAMPLPNGIAGWASKLSRVPVRTLLTEHSVKSLAFGDINGLKHWVLQHFIRSAYGFADAIVGVSGGVVARLKDIPGVSPQRVHMIHNPVYTPLIEVKAQEPVQHPWLLDGSLPVVLAVGRLAKEKDFATLIRAFDHLKRRTTARLIILGEGEERVHLESLVDELGLQDSVDLPGFVVNPWSYMARASVLALSSLHEGFGNVLVEAMACGTSVVSTDCPSGPAEILDCGRYGALTETGNARALAEAIQNLIERPTPADILRKRAREFSKDLAADEYLRLLASLQGYD